MIKKLGCEDLACICAENGSQWSSEIHGNSSTVFIPLDIVDMWFGVPYSILVWIPGKVRDIQ